MLRAVEARSVRPDWEFWLALLTYAAASVADYMLTVSGLVTKEIRELNPLLRAYIDHWGAAWGLIVPKLILGGLVVAAASLYLHAMHRTRRTRIRPQHLLYPGALLTAVAPAHWVLLKLWWTGGLFVP